MPAPFFTAPDGTLIVDTVSSPHRGQESMQLQACTVDH